MAIIGAILAMGDYGQALDDIMPYGAASHRAAILTHILDREDYDLLEPMTTYMSNDMKLTTLHKLLSKNRLDIIEDIMPTFNRKHKDVIVEHFINIKPHNCDQIDEYLESFMPFFDKKQIKKLEENNNE